MAVTQPSAPLEPATLTLVRATPEQARLVRSNTLDWFCKWDKLTAEEWEQQDEGTTVDAQTGVQRKRMDVWLLVHRSTLQPTKPATSSATLDKVYVHFETYRMPALFSLATESPKPAFVYGIGTVWTPPQHRRKGYARLALQLAHYLLGEADLLPPFPTGWGSPPPFTLGDGVASVLNSDVGTTYYTSCTIGESRPGWVEQGSTVTEWDIGPDDATGPDISDWRWINSLAGVRVLEDLAIDAATQAHEKARGTSITILPTGDVLTGHHNRLLLRLPFPAEKGPQRPTSFAACSPDTSSLLVYYPTVGAVSYPPFENKGKTLCITHIAGRVPWRVVREAARREGCVRVEIWGPLPLDVLADWPSGRTIDRGDLYSMMAYYGPRTGEETPAWLGNGMWIPCRTWNFKRALEARGAVRELL